MSESKEQYNARKLQEQNDYFKKYPWVRSFWSARWRCNAPKHRYYKKGIKLLMTEKDFRMLWFRDNASSMKRPSIDRIDPKGHYEISNCRFIELGENVARAHRGVWKHKSKLTPSQVIVIRHRYALGGITHPQLGEIYGVARTTISNLLNGYTWRHV